jgi:hypothetical protein
MITRISRVIRPKGSDLIFDHPYNADYERLSADWVRGSAEHRSTITALDLCLMIGG